MKPLILLVEDNPGVLLNITVTLEFNDYEVISAKNGKEGLSVLEKVERLPDLIISDIMMPEMDGYEFFENVSENPKWNQIPFFFLTARASPEDIRFGKMLGIDDYLTKPFKENDLLAAISGKISRKKKIKELLSSLDIEMKPSISEKQKEFIIIALFTWDDKLGPVIASSYPEDLDLPFSLTKIGVQLFNATSSIYGQTNLQGAQGILLNIKNIEQFGYLYFDSILDENARGGQNRFYSGCGRGKKTQACF